MLPLNDHIVWPDLRTLAQNYHSKLFTAKNVRMLLSQGGADIHLEEQSVFHEVSP